MNVVVVVVGAVDVVVDVDVAGEVKGGTVSETYGSSTTNLAREVD